MQPYSTTRTLGGLTCQVINPQPNASRPRLAVVLCHGFGAPGTDLVPLAGELMRLFPELTDSVQWIFPAAPLTLDHQGLYGGRAWWPLDVAELTRSVETGEFRDLRSSKPPGLDQARKSLLALLKTVQVEQQLGSSEIVLGGFSQGAMLATDVALRLPAPPAGLAIFSGTLLCEEEWKPLVLKRGAFPVVQSHGRQDPILPFEAAVWLRDLLQEGGIDVDFIPFNGIHTIPFEAVKRYGELLKRLLDVA